MSYAPFQLAERFERALGDPCDALVPFSYPRCAELDDREEFPTDICRELDRLGLAGYYVPSAFGGSLASFEELSALLRLIARRDLTVAVAHVSTFLGAGSVWLAGDDRQRTALAAEIKDGSVVSLALTEREHGSDLLAGEVSTTGEHNYLISGEKWLIGNVSRGQFVCALVRTEADNTARGFSLLLVDKRRLQPGSYHCLPAEPTIGIRGAEISGIVFDAAAVSADALVGQPGTGLETVLKCLQLTRTLCGPMSLGVGDQALRSAMRIVLDAPEPTPGPVAQLGPVFTDCYVDLLVAEAVTFVVGRSVHTQPAELSVNSAVVKYFVPVTVEQVIADLGVALGARSSFGDLDEHGIFAKLERDHHIMSIFDGNTFVNLTAIINQFPQLVRGYQRASVDAQLGTTVTFSATLPELDPSGLRLTSRHGSSVMQNLPSAVEQVAQLCDAGLGSTTLGSCAKELRDIADELHEELAGCRPSARDVSAQTFDLARRYTVVFAAAACLQLWIANQNSPTAEAGGALWSGGLWLEAAMVRLLGRLRPEVSRAESAIRRLADPMCAQYQAGLLYSLLRCRLEESV